MANTTNIQIKRSISNAAPTSLKIGELAYSYNSNTLFIGTTTSDGRVSIGGQYLVDRVNTVYNQANAAYNAANSGTSAGAAFDQANTARDSANDATTTAASAFNKANLAGGNINAFSNLSVGGTFVVADSNTDFLTIIQGNNIIMTANNANDSFGIAANLDTSWTFANNLATAGNSYAVQIGTSGNNYTDTVGTNVGTGANAYADTVGTNAGTGANAYADTLAVAGNSYTGLVATWANTANLTANNNLVTVGSAYDQANTGTTYAGAAYDKANTLSTYDRYEYDASLSQNTFNLTYTVGYVDVWINGAKIANTDFTATDGTTVVLTTPTEANDIVEFIAWSTTGVNSVNGKLLLNIVTKTENYSVLTTDYCVLCTTQDFTVTLPSAAGIDGQVFVIKNLNTFASANLINVNTTSSQTIDNDGNYATISPRSALTFMSDGSNWILI